MNVINSTEQDERAYLEEILQKLEWALHHADQAAKQFTKAFRENEEYLYDQRSGMDDADRVSAGQSFKRMAFEGESTIAVKKRMRKLLESPYFGRIDFIRTPTKSAVGAGPDGRSETLPIYIGVHSFADGMKGRYLIYDWRAPVSSMFYDFELGDAWYEAKAGVVKGMIGLRRQYRIRHGKMEYMIENDINIQDDVLQKELSQSSDDKMKTIVATIQRDQNVIIRNESSRVLIIQGVAGSGKTSIAIHRIAFLLYRFRDTISAGDILIISPNKVFADYISNVLPELGEAQIPELGMEEFAHDLLDHKYKFHTFLEQVFQVIHPPDNNRDDHGFMERVRFKSSAELVGQLNRYLINLENHLFVASDLVVGRTRVPAAFIQKQFKSLHRVPLLSRLPMVVNAVELHLKSSLKRKLSGTEKSHLYKSVSGAMGNVNLLELYSKFYDWLGRKDLFRMDHNLLEYTDVFPLIYCKIRLEGMQPYQHVKHLVIDEMQDYTPIQYAVLARLFPCKKTILGDASQAVSIQSVSTAEEIHRIFPQADVVKLFRSYRSTYEITRFTEGIIANPDLVAIERHGPVPEVKGFPRSVDEEEEIKRLVNRFRASPDGASREVGSSAHQSMAIICKTPRQAKVLSKLLDAKDVFLLTEESTSFKAGVVITTVPLAKGLEFDEVLVPFVSADQYHTDLDRRLLYIACTRALHQLTLTFTKERSGFLASPARRR